ncbi:MAG: sugar O-acyltransferase (sialic acid O-acetyltransferase NeuD family) [Paracoccaceae bacterium]
MTQRVLIMGTTSYTEVFLDMFEAVPGIEFTGYIRNQSPLRGDKTVERLPVHWHEDINEMVSSHKLICSLATVARSDWIEEMTARGFDFVTLLHPSAVVSNKTKIGRGVSVDAGVVIAGYSQIGEHVRIGRRVSFGHHTSVGAYSTLHPGCIVSGQCKIGTKVTLGTGSVILDGCTVGDGAVVAAGAIVTKDVPKQTMVAGNPAQIKKHF